MGSGFTYAKFGRKKQNNRSEYNERSLLNPGAGLTDGKRQALQTIDGAWLKATCEAGRARDLGPPTNRLSCIDDVFP